MCDTIICMEELKFVIASNIVKYRTSIGITQLELAEKLNYSDKSVSKWERGAALPDVIVLKKMAELFGVKVDDFFEVHEGHEIVLPPKQKTRSRVIISLLACGLVWLVATLVYVVLNWIGVAGSWKSFVYAIPVTFIVAIVFSALWGKRWLQFTTISLFVWTLLASIYITFIGTKAWLLFLIGIPTQILVILWYTLIQNNRAKKK